MATVSVSSTDARVDGASVAQPGSSSPSIRFEETFHSTMLRFPGKGNPQPAKYTIVPSKCETEAGVKHFAESFLLHGLSDKGNENESEDEAFERTFLATPPKVLISVTGGAQAFFMKASKLEQVFSRGLLKAVQTISAWIVDGGLDAGVMQHVGNAIKETAVEDVPCIGIASLKMVILNDKLSQAQLGPGYDYVSNAANSAKTCALNPNHTHFVLVESPVADWGQEIKFRSELEAYIRHKFQIPVVLLAVNGGPGTLQTVAEGAQKKFAVVIVEGSGRACDAMAAIIKKARHASTSKGAPSPPTVAWLEGLKHDDGVDLTPWNQLLAESPAAEKKKLWTTWMDTILANVDTVTLFSMDHEASSDMDIAILRAILNTHIGQRKLTLNGKLMMGIAWDRADIDIVREILDTELEHGDQVAMEGLNMALEEALIQDRPEIFTILVEKGAQKESVNLSHLYTLESLRHHYRRISAYVQAYPPESPDDEEDDHERDKIVAANVLLALKGMFNACGSAFNGYQRNLKKRYFPPKSELPLGLANLFAHEADLAERRQTNPEVSFTDFLIWAIVSGRFELAQAIWRKTNLPIHAALAACQLYKFLAKNIDEDDCNAGADWFEAEAIKMLDEVEVDDVKVVLTRPWALMNHKTSLDIAGDAECKAFVGHAHVQALLDEIFYEKLEPTTPAYFLWATILFPPFIWWLYVPALRNKGSWFDFYRIPIVTFWTNTLFYCAFLFVQAWVICTLRVNDPFTPVEILLWVWVVAMVIEECVQFYRDPAHYATHLSNQLDVVLLLLHVVYIVLRFISEFDNDEESTNLFSGAINTLIVACVFSWCRVLNIFGIDQSLGPLYFTIVKLFRDIYYWLFVFVIFAVSFQIGFVNITMQAGADPASGYPNGSMPVSFFTIVGDFNYYNDVMDKAPIGIAMLGVYALIAQIILVNLLIAMMGSTYSKVFENSTQEWKFYRLELVMETKSASFHPPPTNLVVYAIRPFEKLFSLCCDACRRKPSQPLSTLESVGSLKGKDKASTEALLSKDGADVQSLHLIVPQGKAAAFNTLPSRRAYGSKGRMYTQLAPSEKKETSKESKEKADAQSFQDGEHESSNLEKMARKIRSARDKVVTKEIEEEGNSVISIVKELQQKMRTLRNERENDRTFVEKKLKVIEHSVQEQHRQLQDQQTALDKKLDVILALLQPRTGTS